MKLSHEYIDLINMKNMVLIQQSNSLRRKKFNDFPHVKNAIFLKIISVEVLITLIHPWTVKWEDIRLRLLKYLSISQDDLRFCKHLEIYPMSKPVFSMYQLVNIWKSEGKSPSENLVLTSKFSKRYQDTSWKSYKTMVVPWDQWINWWR